MPYRFIKYKEEKFAENQILVNMTDEYYDKQKLQLLEAPTDARRVEVMAEFLPADIKNIVKPEDT